MFKNLTNGKRYIGSSENLRNRMYGYFNNNYLLKNTYMNISKSST
jgi:excinuclease UvrABC nuclease subunit